MLPMITPLQRHSEMFGERGGSVWYKTSLRDPPTYAQSTKCHNNPANHARIHVGRGKQVTPIVTIEPTKQPLVTKVFFHLHLVVLLSLHNCLSNWEPLVSRTVPPQISPVRTHSFTSYRDLKSGNIYSLRLLKTQVNFTMSSLPSEKLSMCRKQAADGLQENRQQKWVMNKIKSKSQTLKMQLQFMQLMKHWNLGQKRQKSYTFVRRKEARIYCTSYHPATQHWKGNDP